MCSADLNCYGIAVYATCPPGRREGTHAVIETADYLSDAKAAGMADAEREAVIMVLASNPGVGSEIPGTGGARKVRVADAARARAVAIG
jgi:hypothetical protein